MPKSECSGEELRRKRMVSWYHPGQLVLTAMDVLTSTVVGGKSDLRLVEALAANSNAHYDYSQEQGEKGDFWFDYVADTGDGWNSTYHVAYAAGQPELEVSYKNEGGIHRGRSEGTLPDDRGSVGTGGSYRTVRGRVLVFGGDEVYPVPSNRAYRERLVEPYQCAINSAEPVGDVFALPGNHDWYDGLIAFGRLFCSTTCSYPGRHFGAWRTRQRRSYFALKLPRGWWLAATDVQLCSDLDAPQLDYFRDVARQMAPHDRIILCHAEPHWIYSKAYSRFNPEITEHNLSFLEEKVFGHQIAVFIAGDLHHYRRHATEDGKQKITAGGGGAFLHPTHGLKVESVGNGYRYRKSYPPPAVSHGLAYGNLLFLFKNPAFGILPATLYVLTAWSMKPEIGHFDWSEMKGALDTTWAAFYASPFTAFWVLAILLGMAIFTETHSKAYRWIAGPLHGIVHLAALFFIGWGAARFAHEIASPSGQLATIGAIIFAGGWIVGSTLMGFYLLISLNLFGRHTGDAFSSLRIQDWKSFLRFKIDREGVLTIFPIGIRRVARRWKRATADSCSIYAPNDRLASEPELIEAPIRVG